MSDRRKMNLEELRKSFPSLDDFSAKKLLGGDYWNPNWANAEVGGGDFVRMPSGNAWGQGDWFMNQVMSQPSNTRPTGGGGDAYFGDADDWDDSYGDMGGDSWGDGGWDAGGSGGYEPDYDGNPGGTQGGNMTWPSFATLWGNYPPSVDGAPAHPSVDPYPNQCAIRVGYTLQQSGIDISSYPEINQTTDGYPRSAKGLADWIWQNFGPPLQISLNDFQANYTGQTGLFFEYATPGNTHHIDLWNEGTTGSGFFTGPYQAIWFWPIN